MREFLPIFDREFAPYLVGRAPTFRAVIEELRDKPRIVETGSVRVLGNWADGQSTILFDRLVDVCGGSFSSVNIDRAAVMTAISATKKAEVFCGDSVQFLAQQKEPIDLLYLDSLDYDPDNPIAAWIHQIYELTAASRLLRPGSIVMLDDTIPTKEGEGYYGKGGLAGPYLDRIGAVKIAVGDSQIAWKIF